MNEEAMARVWPQRHGEGGGGMCRLECIDM